MTDGLDGYDFDETPEPFKSKENGQADRGGNSTVTSQSPPASATPQSGAGGVTLNDFYAYMPQHKFVYAPSRELWPAESVNGRLPRVLVGYSKDGKANYVSPSRWLDINRPIEQMIWAPGSPMVIRDRLIFEDGWIVRPNVSCFNLFLPAPQPTGGDPAQVGPWLDHIRRIYPEDVEHIVFWLAHRLQRPAEKINHALVLGGLQGIGKDSMLEPVKRAVGHWNCQEASPTQVMGRFNGFLKSIILRVSEARDLGESDRYKFYEHMKAYTATPPDVLRIDEKNLREHYIMNCCGVIITTNHKVDGIYLSPDDRRHYVAWSNLTKEDFEQVYWDTLWGWYDGGGDRHVAAYLAGLDLTPFNSKAPPLRTPAFWDIVNAHRAPEDAELADTIDRYARNETPKVLKILPAPVCPDQILLPHAVTLAKLLPFALGDFKEWLEDRKNRRVIPHRFEACGYVPVRNPDAKDGLWRIDSRREVVYAQASLSRRDQIAAAKKLL
jgi:hypothetical protein